LNSPSKEDALKFLIKKLEGQRTMVFSSSIKQCDSLFKHTYHSKTDNKDLLAFKKGEIDLLGLVNAGGTGHTYKEIDNLVVVQADSDKNGLTSQKVSRTLLQQPSYKATIWVLSLMGTQDEKWVDSFLKRFDRKKVNYIHFKNFENGN